MTSSSGHATCAHFAERSRAHAENFSWNATAAATLEVYRQAAIARSAQTRLTITTRTSA